MCAVLALEEAVVLVPPQTHVAVESEAAVGYELDEGPPVTRAADFIGDAEQLERNTGRRVAPNHGW